MILMHKVHVEQVLVQIKILFNDIKPFYYSGSFSMYMKDVHVNNQTGQSVCFTGFWIYEWYTVD